MKWALSFLLKILFKDDASFYDFKREIIEKVKEKNNCKVTELDKIYNPPYEFEIMLECEDNESKVYKLEFSVPTPYTECVFECNCGCVFKFLPVDVKYLTKWSDNSMSSKGCEGLMFNIIHHKFEVSRPCINAREIEVNTC